GQMSAPGTAVNGVVRPAPPLFMAPADLFDITNTTMTISGTGIPESTISLVDGGSGSLVALGGDISVDRSGAWNSTVTLGYGTHVLTAIQTNGGEASAPSHPVEGIVVPPPAIDSFSAAAVTITAGSTARLLATFRNGVGRIDQEVGLVSSGTPVISPV